MISCWRDGNGQIERETFRKYVSHFELMVRE